MRLKNRNPETSGFSLIELVFSIGIFVIIIVLGANGFYTILRQATKTKVINLVKHEGNYALSVMELMIRNARKIVDCDLVSGEFITLQNSDGEETTFRFCGVPDLLIASESGSLSCSQARLTSNQVEMINGMFSCQEPTSEIEPYVVGIYFELTQAGTKTRVEEQASEIFQTTVSIRNF